ncbi:MAG: GumC family protein [Polaribacter sp.]
MKSNSINDSNSKAHNTKGYKDLFLSYFKYWYWFLLCFIVCTILAYTSLKYTIPMYDVSSTIVISQEDNLSDAGLSVFKDLGLDQTQDKIENEIQILKSKTLIRNVIKKLKLNVQYFYEGRVLDIEEYKNPIVRINFLVADSILAKQYGTFNIRVKSETSFSFVDDDYNDISSHKFGTSVSTKVGNAVLIPNLNNINASIGLVIKIKLVPTRSLVDSFRGRLSINVVGQNSSVLQVYLRDAVIERAENFIDNLIDEYGKRTIKNKNETSNKTAEFINDRLNEISKNLSNVDSEAAKYMSKYGVSEDISGASGRLADISLENKKELAIFETQTLLIQSTIDFINDKQSKNDLIPSNLGLDDSAVSTEIGKYNTLVLQRKRLLKTSTLQNPIVINIDDQLEGLRDVLLQSLNSLKNRVVIKLNRVKQRNKKFESKIFEAPEIQKDLRKIGRDQGVTEQLYLYLLQKKEEADITSHITVPNSRVIDRATAISLQPVSPNKKSTYLLSSLLGFLIPFVIIYAKDLFSTSIKSKKDIEELVSIPFLGSIPKSKSKNQFVINKTNTTPISEAFRILRTNIDFLLAGVKKETGKVIFTTSSISGEGKTFISSNIAKSLAISGKKVVYIGTDFRFPKFHEILELPDGKMTKGFTNFITDINLRVEDIICKENNENDAIAIIPPGIIPPNPSGLLMNERVQTMFTYLEKHYDYIVVDTAPVSLVTDTLLISKLADITVYVVKENYSDKGLLSIPEKYHLDGRLVNLAILLNYASSNMSGTYGYGYGYNAKR